MQIDPALHPEADNYKLLTNLVVPRPIAWITSADAGGTLNLAPFSFFNAVGSQPVYIVVSIGRTPAGGQKDTAANILARREFVVNMVSEELFAAMNLSAADFPPGVSEVEACGLATAPSVKVGVPRLADAPASLECRLHDTVPLGDNTLFIGEVVMFHIADPLVGPRLRIEGYAPIGRLGSPSVYCRTTERFDVPRVRYAEWAEMTGGSCGEKTGIARPMHKE